MRLHRETPQQPRNQDEKQHKTSFKSKFLKKTESILAYARNNLHFHEDHRASIASRFSSSSSSSSNRHSDAATTIPSDKQLANLQLSQCRIASSCFLSEGEDKVDASSAITNKDISNHCISMDVQRESSRKNEEFVQQHPCVMEHQLSSRQMIPLEFVRNQNQPCDCQKGSLHRDQARNGKSQELVDPFGMKIKERNSMNNMQSKQQQDLQEKGQFEDHKLSKGDDDGLQYQEECQQKAILQQQQQNIHKLIQSQQKEEVGQLEQVATAANLRKTTVTDACGNTSQLSCSSDEGDIIKPTGSRFQISVGIEGEEDENRKDNIDCDEDEEDIHNIDIHKDIPSSLTKVKQINFMEAWLRVKTMDLSREKKAMEEIKKSVKSEGKLGAKKKGLLKKLFSMCTVIPLLHSSSSPALSDASLQQEMDQLLAYSSQSIDLEDKLHQSMIGSIYCQLRNTDHCPLIGQHWLTIGFKHPSPKYNFDIAGIFGALQILAFIFCYREYLVDALSYIDGLDNQQLQEESKVAGMMMITTNNDKKRRRSYVEKENLEDGRSHIGGVGITARKTLGQQFALPEKDILKPRQKEIHLCVVMQEISKVVLQLLERRQLNHMILAEKSVIGVVNKVYFAVFVLYFEKFKLEKTGLESSRNILKSTMEYVAKHTQESLDLFKKQIASFYKNRD